MRGSFLLMLCGFVATMDAVACSCPNESFGEKIDKATFVGLVRIEAAHFNSDYRKFLEAPDGMSWQEPIHATFTALETMKGDAATVQRLSSGYGGATADFRCRLVATIWR